MKFVAEGEQRYVREGMGSWWKCHSTIAEHNN